MQRLALLSVSDKTGIIDFAQKLIDHGFQIISTGGTKKELERAKIPVTSVEDVTGFPECLGGRVKTMHPLITGGILYKRGDATHESEVEKLHIPAIDLIAINLYPFKETIAKPDITIDDAIEQIDIGGPTLLRSAAKNHKDVIAICDPADYDRVVDALDDQKILSDLKKELAIKVFAHTAAYDGMIAKYLSDDATDSIVMTNGKKLRYGENPHQKGFFYTLADDAKPQFIVHQGKEISYLNILDADGAWTTVCEFEDPTVVMVKHANPSGIASRKRIEDAFQAAYDADRLSAFGVIIALNRECTGEIIKKILDQKMFVEIIIAPSYQSDALELLKQKPNIRAIEMHHVPNGDHSYRSAMGGILVQDLDTKVITEKDLKIVTDLKPTKEQIADLLFAWKCVKHTKSNAIVFAKEGATVGIGAGQTSRVDATWIAAKRAGDKAKGSVMASDAFFPFPDSLEEAAKHGIAAVIQPGGSIKDAEVIAKANEVKIPMIFTGFRAFWH